jgi:uncharacterized surface protein with fasciclin (FAS1) repeats
MNKTMIKNSAFSFAMALACLCSFGLLNSCSEDYDNHYAENTNVVTGKTLTDIIKEKSELSVFASLMEKTGYDKILASSQSFTVFAPTNDALSGVNVNDQDQALKVVKNHIARFIYSASGNVNEIIYMLNFKKIPFANSGSSYSVGGVSITSANIASDNGVLHVLGAQIPLRDNIWEYMTQPGFESIRDYMYQYTKNEFDPYASKVVDINEEGEPVYDSIFEVDNVLWHINLATQDKGIGFLNNEDSLYTMLMPNENAWNQAYALAEPYFKVSEDFDDAAEQQDINTRYAIIKSLAFRGDINPDQFENESDSILTTRQEAIYNPARLFEGTHRIEASNGTIYVMNNFTLEPTDAWHREIRVESENAGGRESSTDCQLITRSVMDHPEVSEYRYLDVMASATGSRPWVQFEIPNTLAYGKYNIYAVFVPRSVTGVNTEDSTRVRITVSEKRAGTWVTIRSNGETGASFIPVPNNYVRGQGITKMLLSPDGEPWVFANANYLAEENTIRIRIACSITAAEYSKGFTNNFRVDCIILEPVKE